MFPKFHDSESRDEGGWTLADRAGERCLPRDDFLAVFAWDGRPASRWEELADGERRDVVETLDWSALRVEDWGALTRIFGALPEEPAWERFAAEGGRWAAEQRIAGVETSAAPAGGRTYSITDLSRGEDILGEFFGPEGPLARIRGESYELRQGQLDMALAVWQALIGGSNLVVEAPTGIGKSLAYLVPAGLFSLVTGERIVVSTHTKNLQDQLLSGDLPVLAESGELPVEAVLLKGRENYFCRRKVNRYLGGRQESREDVLAAATLVVWSAQSGTGLAEELSGHSLVPESLIRELKASTLRQEELLCARERRCWVTRSREKARAASLVLVNHSLLFADYAVGHGILGEYGHLVIDEAHHLDSVATKALGVVFSQRAVDKFLLTGAPENRRTRLSRDGFRAWFPEAAALAREYPEAGLLEPHGEVCEFLYRFREEIRGLLAGMAELPPVADALSRNGRMRYRAEDALFVSLAPAQEEARNLAFALRKSLGRLGEAVGGLRQAGRAARLEIELMESLSRSLSELVDRLDFLLAAAGEDHVFFVEAGKHGIREIVASPVDVRVELGDFFREGLTSAVLTSATLSVAENFDYFIGKSGLDRSERETHCLRLESSFDFDRQARVLLPAFLPEPGHPGYLEASTRLLATLLKEVPLSALILFTSYQAMGRSREGLIELGVPKERILMQGESLSRDALARRFRESPGAVLLGTSSFWEGVDFPGDSLQLLVMARLPFAVPTEPLVQARCERIEADGGSPFGRYMIPEAVLRFRQGFGRLIRSKRDEGLVVFLDSRLSGRSYGKSFLTSLPTGARLCFDEESFFTEMHDWYIAKPRTARKAADREE